MKPHDIAPDIDARYCCVC